MKLQKQLSCLDVFCLASGAMISSGIFILPGIAFAKSGPAVMVSYFLAGLLALVGTLSIIELATALPKAGGDYFFITRSLGPVTGTVSGLLSWFAISLKTAFAIFGIAQIIYMLSGIPPQITSILLCAFFTLLNIRGTKEVSKYEVILVLTLLMLLALYVMAGIPHAKTANFTPFSPKGWGTVFSTTGFIFVSFGGLLNIASISEEIKNPRRNIPLGLLAAVLSITIIYVLMLVVTIGLLPGQALSGSLTPIADGARQSMGTPGFVIITTASLLAFITTAIAGLMSASRYPLGLSHDGLLPAPVSRMHKKFHTPAVSISLTGGLIALCVLLDLDVLVKMASTVILASYVLTNISVIVLRESGIQNYRPTFKTPLYPWIQIASIIVFSILIANMGLGSIEITLGFITFGLLMYFFYGRKNAPKEYALVHLIENIMNKELTSHALEDELKDIIHQRDDIVTDRFDHLAEEAPVLDIETNMELGPFLEQVAGMLSRHFELDLETTHSLLVKREEESSTAISPFIAIPHLILEGEKKFQLFLVRNKNGIQFNDQYPAIKAVFILAGTKDERQFHLQALAAIAQIAQNPDFETLWLNAANPAQLRHVITLSKRFRH